jgi:hypothetical protein
MSDAITEQKITFRGRYLQWQRIAEYVIVVAIVLESIVFAAIAPQFFRFRISLTSRLVSPSQAFSRSA